jgi:hypothetical protein
LPGRVGQSNASLTTRTRGDVERDSAIIWRRSRIDDTNSETPSVELKLTRARVYLEGNACSCILRYELATHIPKQGTSFVWVLMGFYGLYCMEGLQVRVRYWSNPTARRTLFYFLPTVTKHMYVILCNFPFLADQRASWLCRSWL